MRLFIGLSLPDHISSHISTMRGSLPSVYWYDPDSYHIALCFMDEIKNYNLINDLDLALEKITMPDFELTIQGVSHFTSSTYQNYFSACVAPSPALLQLKKKINYTLSQLDIKLINKQHFTPRVTLANGVGITEDQISNWLYKYNLFKTEPFTVHQFSLFSSYPQKKQPLIVESNYLLR